MLTTLLETPLKPRAEHGEAQLQAQPLPLELSCVLQSCVILSKPSPILDTRQGDSTEDIGPGVFGTRACLLARPFCAPCTEAR